jgi:hypothetical protein
MRARIAASVFSREIHSTVRPERMLLTSSRAISASLGSAVQSSGVPASVVERGLVVAQTEFLVAPTGGTHLLRELDRDDRVYWISVP